MATNITSINHVQATVSPHLEAVSWLSEIEIGMFDGAV